MTEVSAGDLVCLIPHHDDYSNPTVGLVLQDWSSQKHGDRIEIRWLNHGCNESEPHYIQKLDKFGTVTF